MELPEVSEVFEDRYKLVEVLGRGGFATVFRAEDQSISRDVVIKILAPRDGEYSEGIRARFLREARVFADLHDPHTITMYHFGISAGGLLYMVFEHVRGRDLAAVIAEQGPLAPDVVAHILRQLLSALREAHDLGILHRDIKPANILVFEYDGDPYRIKLIDFGIAKDVNPGAVGLTKTGRVVGTPRYMTPEQVVGEPIGPDSDLFTLGLVAFEMLTGVAALGGASQYEVLRSIVAETPLQVPAGAADGRLRAVIDRMMARDRGDRYPNASAVLQDLRRARPASAPGPGAPDGRAPSRRGLRWAYLLGGAALPIAAFAIVMSSTDPPSSPASQRRVVTSDIAAILKQAPGAETAPTVVPVASDVGLDLSARGAVGGCGAPPPFLGQRVMSSDRGGRWTAHIPGDYDPDEPHPLLLMFHRKLSSGDRFLADARVPELADEKGVIVFAFDSATSLVWSADDMDVVHEALAVARRTLCVDDSRLYAIGEGIGSTAVAGLSCEIHMSATAVSAVDTAKGCVPIAPTSRIRLVGKRDRNIPFEGGMGCNVLKGRMVPSLDIDAAWAARFGCSGEPQPWRSFPGGECRAWDCVRGALVSCETSSGHYWPDAAPPLVESPGCSVPPPTTEFPYRDAIWQFFEHEGQKAISP